MRYNRELLTVFGVLLITLPVEALVTDKLSVAHEEVKIAQGEGKEQFT